jgi:hypothetical protein
LTQSIPARRKDVTHDPPNRRDRRGFRGRRVPGGVRRSRESSAIVVPGTSRELVAAALEAGLRFTRPPGLLLLGAGVEPPRALAISGYSLF